MTGAALPVWARYVAVGGLATAAHYGLLGLAVEWWRWPPPLAAGAGAALGAQVAFIGNRGFTFSHRGSWRTAWWRFQLTALLGMALSAGLVALGGWLGVFYLLSQMAATLLGLLLTYAVNRRWTFGASP